MVNPENYCNFAAMNESMNDQTLLYPLLFEPNLHTVVWGGGQLRPYKGLTPSDEPIGESWEVSAVPTSTSMISNGRWYEHDQQWQVAGKGSGVGDQRTA